MARRAPKKIAGPYIPKRATADEKALRRVAACLPDQMQLNTYLMRVGIGRNPDGTERHPAERRREIQRGAYLALLPYLKFQATMPAFIQEPLDPGPGEVVVEHRLEVS
jgi:hypothetical protein